MTKITTTKLSSSEEETYSLGFEFGKTLKGGEVIALEGQLGAGKTVFTKGLAAALGVKATVTSPTFTLLNVYKGNMTLCHIDAYRLSSGEEAYARGLTEYFDRRDGVCVIEWASNIESALPIEYTVITFSLIGDNAREIKYEFYE
jgi:tRNA threonylcarbamoyladenosine biosynthesis protein TsaE